MDRPQTVTDGRHLIVYAQRTADGRIAMGGRGAPYHFALRPPARFDRDERVFASIPAPSPAGSPQLADVDITHRWGGPLGVPRDWSASVGYDRGVGPGVGAAATWATGWRRRTWPGARWPDLVTGTDSPLVQLPWVDQPSRRWEPEPLRWIGINTGLRLTAAADAAEARTGRPSRALLWLRSRIMGR